LLSTKRRNNWPLFLGTFIVLLMLIIVIFGPSLAPQDPLQVNRVLKVDGEWQTPPFPAFRVSGFPLGSDQFGRDLFSRLLWAVRPTLTMVVVVAGLRMLIGIFVGMGSGWSRRLLGRTLESMTSLALAVPVIIVALFVIAAVGVESGIWAFILGLGITGWAATARHVHEQVREIRGEDYIEAAHALGAAEGLIVMRHVLRQVLPRTWMFLTSEISSTLMAVAGLGFLGYYLGGDVWIEFEDYVAARISGSPELGQMLASSVTTDSPIGIFFDPWGMLAVGGVIFIAILGFNLMGEGLRRSSSLQFARTTWWSTMWGAVAAWTSDRFRRGGRKARLTVYAGLSFLLILFAGGLIWRTGDVGEGAGGNPMSNPGGHQWSGDRANPYGTRWVPVRGPSMPVARPFLVGTEGLVGGPAVAADGTVYIVSEAGSLYALAPEGRLLWEAKLRDAGIGSPALDAEGNIYAVDRQGGIASFTSSGDLRWQFEPLESTTPVAGPTIGISGDIYYPIGGSIQALSSFGDPLWTVRGFPYELRTTSVQQSLDGKTLVWVDLAFDAKTGEQLELELVPGLRYTHLISAAGTHYMLSGEGGGLSAVEWQQSEAGPVLLDRVAWNVSDISASLPTEAGITADGEAWLYYGRTYLGASRPSVRLVWGDMQGRILADSRLPLSRPSVVIGADSASRLFVCGLAASSEALCFAYSSASDEPLWEVNLGAGVTPVGGALAEGKLYVSTDEGKLIVLENLDNAN